MLDEHQRIAVLELTKKGFGSRRIGRALEISRSVVRVVVESGTAPPPKIVRPQKAVARLRAAGQLRGEEVEVTVLVAKNLTAAETKEARKHGIGDVVPFNPAYRRGLEVEAGEHLQVRSVDVDGNAIGRSSGRVYQVRRPTQWRLPRIDCAWIGRTRGASR